MSKHVVTCSNMFWHVLKCPKMSKFIQKCKKMWKNNRRKNFVWNMRKKPFLRPLLDRGQKEIAYSLWAMSTLILNVEKVSHFIIILRSPCLFSGVVHTTSCILHTYGSNAIRYEYVQYVWFTGCIIMEQYFSQHFNR